MFLSQMAGAKRLRALPTQWLCRCKQHLSSLYLKISSGLNAFSCGLFSRSFLLIALLMLACLGIWFAVFVEMGVGPRASQTSKRIATAVNLTRTAFIHSHGSDRTQLLTDLSRHESLDVHTRLISDRVHALPDDAYWQKIAFSLQKTLGPDTIIAWRVNNKDALWVSFGIEQSHYWLAFEREQFVQTRATEWVSWTIAALVLSLIGAAISVRYLNRPLTRLARFAQTLSRAGSPQPLPEAGPTEIRALNASFNRMARDLRETAHDRELMLAGISHDLRTPLTRIRLEIELSPMPQETIRLIDMDLEQINQSLDKFLEYARAAQPRVHSDINIARQLAPVLTRETIALRSLGGTLTTTMATGLYAHMEALSLERIVTNLLENARRYGCDKKGVPHVCLVVSENRHDIMIEISDTGQGIAEQDTEYLLRPFSRGNAARTGCASTGLGLAIVDRLVRQAGGSLRLLTRPHGGLTAQVRLPRA